LLFPHPSPASEQTDVKSNENNLCFNIGLHGINVALGPIADNLFNLSLSVGN
jgi:hypothetical protein